MENVYKAAKEFLDPIYEQLPTQDGKPFVTLTFAQSLDGKIAKKGQQLLLSGKESMAMTHRLRILHDGIMVGIGTALVDDPQLNARHLSVDDLSVAVQPQPIILDPFLRLPVNCKLLKNFQNNTGKQPWVVATEKGVLENKKKQMDLEKAGAKIYSVKSETDRVPLLNVLELLRSMGIKSLMIEGGAKIIQSCLKNQLYDQLIVTIAPKFVGIDGVNAVLDEKEGLKNVKYQTMGDDIVLSASLN
ncbi:unnamed protein product [Rhizopus stolonifer]